MKTMRVADLIEKFFADSDPLAMSTAVTLASGTSAVADQAALMNDYDMTRPFLIDAIHFQVSTLNWSAFQRQTGRPGTNLGCTFRVHFSLGRHQMSRVPVPVGLFGPPLDGASAFDSFAGQLNSYESVTTAGGGALEFNGHYIWRLPRPLLVPPNMLLEARVVRSADGFAADATLGICYIGRQARRSIPGAIPVAIPYVGLLEQRFPPAGVFTSGQHDLWNPFAKPLHVQRLIGRLQILFRQTPAEQLAEIAAGVLGAGVECVTVDIEPEAVNFTTLTNVSGGLAKFPAVQLRRFDGQNMTLGPQPGIVVFDSFRRVFPMNSTLAPRQGYEATLDGSTGLPFVGSLGSNTAFISMIGWREETL